MMTGDVKYKRNSLACKMQGTQYVSIPSGHLKIKKGLILYLYWSLVVTLPRVYLTGLYCYWAITRRALALADHNSRISVSTKEANAKIRIKKHLHKK